MVELFPCNLVMKPEYAGNGILNQRGCLRGCILLRTDGVCNDHVIKFRIEKDGKHDHGDRCDHQMCNRKLGLKLQILI